MKGSRYNTLLVGFRTPPPEAPLLDFLVPEMSPFEGDEVPSEEFMSSEKP